MTNPTCLGRNTTVSKSKDVYKQVETFYKKINLKFINKL